MKFFFLFLSMMVSYILKSQTALFSTDYQEYCIWNDSTSHFENCQGADESTLFTLNKTKTQFIHTTDQSKSAYFIDSWNYDQPNDVYIYKVTSDVGNKYTFVIDLHHYQIRILGIDAYGHPYMLKHYIKKYWVENDWYLSNFELTIISILNICL